MALRGVGRTAWLRGLGWLAAVAMLAVALLAPAGATGTDGNNGTVKIHEGDTETEPGPQNEPHVCEFHLHFFFADPEQSGNWEIQVWEPTDGDKGEVVWPEGADGNYDTSGTGEDREPDEGVFTLPDGHYKLFWDGDLDSDKHDKHKVFWVDCDETTTTTTTTNGTGTVSETTTTTGTTTTGTTTTTNGTGTVSETTTTGTTTTVTGTGSVSETTSSSTTTLTGTGSVSETTGTGTITLPPTSTVDPASGSNSALISFGLLLLAVASFVVALARPLATRKVDDR